MFRVKTHIQAACDALPDAGTKAAGSADARDLLAIRDYLRCALARIETIEQRKVEKAQPWATIYTGPEDAA